MTITLGASALTLSFAFAAGACFGAIAVVLVLCWMFRDAFSGGRH